MAYEETSVDALRCLWKDRRLSLYVYSLLRISAECTRKFHNCYRPTYFFNQKHCESTFKRLIREDATLISATDASKTIQQLGYVIKKEDAAPQPNGCGVKGELNRIASGLKMTPCIGNSDAHTYERFSPNANGHHQRPDMPRRLENGSA